MSFSISPFKLSGSERGEPSPFVLSEPSMSENNEKISEISNEILPSPTMPEKKMEKMSDILQEVSLNPHPISQQENVSVESPKKEESQAIDHASADAKVFLTFSEKIRPKQTFPMSEKLRLERNNSLPDVHKYRN